MIVCAVLSVALLLILFLFAPKFLPAYFAILSAAALLYVRNRYFRIEGVNGMPFAKTRAAFGTGQNHMGSFAKTKAQRRRIVQ